jgi:tRNA threonylcarbamoyl adenosine modification protein YeaZ
MARVITLALEAATYAGSAALLDGARLLAERSVAMRGREREALMPAVGELMAEQGLAPSALQRVVCGAGPGSFTSLRIAGGIAKGLAMATGAPLVAVSSLALLVASQRGIAPGRYLAALDALRGEHYVELYDVAPGGEIVRQGALRRVASADLESTAVGLSARLVCPDRQGALAEAPHARGAAALVALIDAAGPADLAAWEPAYGRLAEAQVKWEAEHGRPLATR